MSLPLARCGTNRPQPTARRLRRVRLRARPARPGSRSEPHAERDPRSARSRSLASAHRCPWPDASPSGPRRKRPSSVVSGPTATGIARVGTGGKETHGQERERSARRAPGGLGRPAHLRLSRRRHQRDHGRAPARRGDRRFHPGAPRGDARPSWPAATRSSPASSASASRPPGPGAIHLLNGLYDAKLDHQPVLAIVGQQARAALGGDYQQEVDLVSLFKDVAHEYVAHGVDARAGPPPRRPRAVGSPSPSARVTCIIVPNDVQKLAAVERAAARARHGAFRHRLSQPPVVSRRRAISSAPRRCSTPGERVAILVGAGALHGHRRGDRGRRAARRRRRQGAARQGRAPGRPALRHRLDRPARHPAELGADGRLRHAARSSARASPTPSFCRGGPGARRPDRHRRPHARRFAIRWRSTSSATARDTLRALLPLLATQGATAPGATEIEDERRALVDACSTQRAARGRPTRSTRSSSSASSRRACPTAASSTADSGSSPNWFARDLELRRGHDGLALRHAGHDGLRRAVRASRRSSRIPTAR